MVERIISVEITENDLGYDYEFNVSGMTISGVTYYSINEYCRRFNKFQGTIRNWLKKVPANLSREFYITVDGKIFVTKSIELLGDPNFARKVKVKGDMVPFLTKYDWDFWGTVRYENKYQMLTVAKKIEDMYRFILKKNKNTELRLFYVTEENPDLTGFHSHFILWTNNKNKSGIKSLTENYLRGRKDVANTLIENYADDGGAIPYMLKQTTRFKDGYNLLWNKFDEKDKITA